ncbi:hypothetical protein F5Y04DRAFT_281408 [Hypomontagnella monticulosa]|nr:hypothetical protein F5Y04DRAFT_281408 [Hypomontagnella monticulosa]
MQYQLLLALLPLVAAAPGSTAAPSTAVGTHQFDEIIVECPTQQAEDNYVKCYFEKTGANCDQMPDAADRRACDNLWKVTCGGQAGCKISEGRH